MGRRSSHPTDPDAAWLAQANPLRSYRLHPWPVFLCPRELRALEDTSVGLVKLIASLPQRLFQNDASRLYSFYGIVGEWWMALAMAEPNGISAALYRPDFLETERGFRCVEVNGGNPGGWLVSSLAPLYLRSPGVTRLLERERVELRWHNTTRTLFAHLIGQMRGLPTFRADEACHVGITVDPDDERDLSGAAREMCRQEYQAAWREVVGTPDAGGDVIFLPWRELEFRRGFVFHRGRKLSALVEDAVEGGATERLALRSFKAGRVHVTKGPATMILGDKRNLALLSEAMASGPFDASERRLIASAVPWTRCVADREVDFHDTRVRLPELLVNHRARLVLKRASSHDGEQVFLGAFMSDVRWSEAVRAALAEGGWIVQEHLESRVRLLPGPGRRSLPHHIVYGLFVVGGRPAGGLLRVLRPDGYRPLADAAFSDYAMRATPNGDERAEVLPLFEAVIAGGI